MTLAEILGYMAMGYDFMIPVKIGEDNVWVKADSVDFYVTSQWFFGSDKISARPDHSMYQIIVEVKN